MPEASGVAQAGGVLWVHNDSDAPVVYRLDGAGRTEPVTVAGAGVRDWEDLASASCAAGTCLYIAESEALVREHARRGGFPADRVAEVRAIIDPTTAETAGEAAAAGAAMS